MDITPVEVLMLFWPVLLLQLILTAWALVDIARRQRVRYLPKVGWTFVVLFVALFGPIIYLAVGRGVQDE